MGTAKGYAGWTRGNGDPDNVGNLARCDAGRWSNRMSTLLLADSR